MAGKGDPARCERNEPSTRDQTLVINDSDPALADYWQVVGNSLSFVDAATSPYPMIKSLRFGTGKASSIGMMAGPAYAWAGRLTVAPDRRSIVYAQKTYPHARNLPPRPFPLTRQLTPEKSGVAGRSRMRTAQKKRTSSP